VVVFYQYPRGYTEGTQQQETSVTHTPSTAAEQWNARYGDNDYFYGTEPNDFLRQNAESLPDGPMLCIADGEGRNSVFLASLGKDVHSVDISPVGVEKTRRLAADRGVVVNAQIGDLTDFNFGHNKWAAIISIFSHLPSALRRDVHRRVVESLQPGGVVLLEAYTPNQIGRGTGGPQVADMLMSEETLRDEFAGLEITLLQETVRDVVEGNGHTGTAAVVQLIAHRIVNQ
jgi:2-polyprenyl-3-methyl-5-hydroxy-6-metoxy-1,4-benzoquinol methylase